MNWRVFSNWVLVIYSIIIPSLAYHIIWVEDPVVPDRYNEGYTTGVIDVQSTILTNLQENNYVDLEVSGTIIRLGVMEVIPNGGV